MPNFCYNTLTLSGNYLSLNDFWKENRDEDLELFISFQNSVPVIEGESCDEKWNTKWNARDIEFSENISLTHDLPTDISTIEYTFSTAWAPPTLWLNAIIHKYYNIDFVLKYEESGCDFGGFVESQKGIIIKNYSYILSEYNWNLVHKDKLDVIINNYIEDIIEDNIDDYIDIIMEDLSDLNGHYYENIQCYIQERIEQLQTY